MWHTVCFEFCWFTAAVSCLVYGLYYENVFGSALETVHSVVILLDVWYNHPAVSRVTQTWSPDRHRTIQCMVTALDDFRPHSAFIIKKLKQYSQILCSIMAAFFESINKAELPIILRCLSTEAEENKFHDWICCDLVRAINSNSLVLILTPEIISRIWCIWM